MVSPVSDACAIVGVGTNDYLASDETSELGTLVDALANGLADAGLERGDLDGVMLNFVPVEASMDNLPGMIGLPNVSCAFQTWAHSRMNSMVIAQAALLVYAGMARYVACISTFNTSRFRSSYHSARSSDDPEALREGGGPHNESPPYGNVTPPGGGALAMQKYLMKYRYGSEDLAIVSMAQREWAARNPNARAKDRPLTQEGYLASPYVIEPLRIHDFGFLANTAVCVIVASTEDARSMRSRPVLISGMQGSTASPDTFVFGRSGLGTALQKDRPYTAPADMPVYRSADISRDDVQLVGIFDTVSPVVPFGLEEFGFCGEGEALAWMNEGHTRPGGSLPVNTHGGSLAEGLTGGWGAVVELVRQLRGEAGARQIENIEVAQYLMVDRSSIILRADGR